MPKVGSPEQKEKAGKAIQEIRGMLKDGAKLPYSKFVNSKVYLYTDLLPSMVETGIIKTDGKKNYLLANETVTPEKLTIDLFVQRREKQVVQRKLKAAELELAELKEKLIALGSS